MCSAINTPTTCFLYTSIGMSSRLIFLSDSTCMNCLGTTEPDFKMLATAASSTSAKTSKLVKASNFSFSMFFVSCLVSCLRLVTPLVCRYAALIIPDTLSQASSAQITNSATPGLDLGFSCLFCLGPSSFLRSGLPFCSGGFLGAFFSLTFAVFSAILPCLSIFSNSCLWLGLWKGPALSGPAVSLLVSSLFSLMFSI